MPDSSNKHVFQYDADITEAIAKIKSIEEANRRLTKAMGSDFGKVQKVLGTSLEKVATKIVDGKTVKNIEALSTQLQLANGQVVKFSEALTETGKGKAFVGTLQTMHKETQALAQAQNTLQGQTSQLATNFKSSGDISNKFQKELSSFGSVSKVVGQNINEISGNSSKMGVVVQTANGKFLQLNETVKRMPNGIQTVSRSVKDVTGQFSRTSVESLKAQKNFKSFGDNIAQLTKRALLTIPVWFLLRNSIMGVGRALKQGLADIASFDRALQKAKRNLQGSTDVIETNFNRLKEAVTKLSLESGVSVEKITNAFQKFATVGLDFETSLAGANVATKLAVTLFGDAEQNANALARAFRVLADNTNDTRSKSQQLEEVGALLNNLWKDQAFEIDEISGALERFAPIANVAGLSMKETVQVLSALQTAGIRGTRAGRLLSTAMQQLDKNFNKISTTLGINLNAQTTTTLERFLAVNRAITELNKTDKLKATDAIKELYGGVRGGEAPRALVAVADILEDVLSRSGDVKQFNDEFEEVADSVGILAQKYHNLNKEIGKALVSGIVGGDDWAKTLKKITDLQEKSIGLANKSGRIFSSFFRVLTGSGGGIKAVPILGTIVEFGEIIGEETGKASDAARLVGQEVANSLWESYNKALKGGLNKNDLQDLLMQLTTFDADYLKIDPIVYQSLIDKTQELLDNWEDIADEQQEVTLSAVELEPIYEKIVSSKLKELKTQGFLNSEILKAEENLRKQFGLRDKFENSLERQLELERSINEEKRLQSRLGSDSVKLFEIAQSQGTEIAKTIGDVLAGDIDFSSFIRRGGEAVDVFKKEFEDAYKQQQAIQFFSGEQVSGIPGLRGGSGINIEEQGIRGITPLYDTSSAVRSAQVEGQLLKQKQLQPVAEVPVENNFNFNIDPSNLEDLQNQVVDKIAKQLPEVGSKVNQGLAKALYNKQTRTL